MNLTTLEAIDVECAEPLFDGIAYLDFWSEHLSTWVRIVKVPTEKIEGLLQVTPGQLHLLGRLKK